MRAIVPGIIMLAVLSSAEARRPRREEPVRVRVAPPLAREEVRVAAPSPRHVWVPGYWSADENVAAEPDDLYVDTEPPPLQVEVMPVAPSMNHLWIAGHWEWRERRYVWIPGRWEPARAGFRWEAGLWQRDGARWHWRPGRWRKE